MCLNITRATPDYELQIVEFRQQTPSQPLEVHPLALSFPSSVQEELIRDDFIYVPPQNETQQTSNNDCPPEPEKQDNNFGLLLNCFLFNATTLPKNNSNNPKNLRWQSNQNKKHLFTICLDLANLWNSNNSRVKNQQHSNPNKKHLLMSALQNPKSRMLRSLLRVLLLKSFSKMTMSMMFLMKNKRNNPKNLRAAQPREREDERPSFSLGISPPASQPSQPSQPTVSQLEILEEAVVDTGVTAALKFAEATSLEPTLPASEVYKTPEKRQK
ncbi:hypothetical protein AHAS_Ahas18G0105000 [Arachis hypogaea]